MLKQMLLSHIQWENTQLDNSEPLIVKTMLQSKLEFETSFSNEYLPVNLLLKSMTVDTTLQLTRKDWVKEQMDDMDVGKVTQLFKIQQAEYICDSRNGSFRNASTLEV